MFMFLTPVIEDWYTGSFMLMCYLMAACIYVRKYMKFSLEEIRMECVCIHLN